MTNEKRPSLAKAVGRGVTGMIPVVGPIFVAFYDYALELDAARIAEIDDAAGLEGWTEEALVTRLQTDERLVDALRVAIEEGRRTALKDKRRALGRVAGRALQDDAELDLEAAVISALGALEGPHIKYLALLCAGWSEGDETRPTGNYLAEPYKSQMRGQGLLVEAPTYGGGTIVRGPTPFARQVFAELQAAGEGKHREAEDGGS